MWMFRRVPGGSSQHTKPFIENLEGRRLMAVGMDSGMGAMPDYMEVTQVAAPTIPNLVGKYNGQVFPTGIQFTIPVTLNITRQTQGRVKGTLSAPGVGLINFSVSGTINSRGKFTVNYDKNGLQGTISGTRNKRNGNLSGTFRGEGIVLGHSRMISGTFTFVKVRASR